MDEMVWGLYFQDQMTEFLSVHVRNVGLCCNEHPANFQGYLGQQSPEMI